MKVYAYKAALYCEQHGLAIIAALEKTTGKPPIDMREDSDVWPQGPYPYGGGEADTPQHCDECGVFLENPLTPDGDKYVREAAEAFETPGTDQSWEEIAQAAMATRNGPGNGPVVAQWIRFYFAWGQ